MLSSLIHKRPFAESLPSASHINGLFLSQTYFRRRRKSNAFVEGKAAVPRRVILTDRQRAVLFDLPKPRFFATTFLVRPISP
jgi:hypothetical protein